MCVCVKGLEYNLTLEEKQNNTNEPVNIARNKYIRETARYLKEMDNVKKV